MITRRLTVLVAKKNGRVNVGIDQTGRAAALTPGRPTLKPDGKLVVPLPGVCGRAGASVAAEVLLERARGDKPEAVPAVVKVNPQGTARLTATLPASRRLRRTAWKLSMRVRGRRTPLAATLRVGPLGTALHHDSDSPLG